MATNDVVINMGTPERTPSPVNTVAQLLEQVKSLVQKLDGMPTDESVSGILQSQILPLLGKMAKVEGSLDEFKDSVAQMLEKCASGLQPNDAQNLAVSMLEKAEKFLSASDITGASLSDMKTYVEIAKFVSDIKKAETDILKANSDMKKTEEELGKINLDKQKTEAELEKIQLDKKKTELEIEKLQLELEKTKVEIVEKKENIQKIHDEKHRGWTSIAVAICAILFAFFGSAGFARYVKG